MVFTAGGLDVRPWRVNMCQHPMHDRHITGETWEIREPLSCHLRSGRSSNLSRTDSHNSITRRPRHFELDRKIFSRSYSDIYIRRDYGAGPDLRCSGCLLCVGGEN